MPDAVVVGSGPNGLAAAITIAAAGRSVTVIEAADLPGGSARSAELTLPGFVHDLASAIHPMAVASPFFSGLPLAAHGLEWVHSPAVLAHPLDDAPAAVLERSLDATAEGLGADGAAWRDTVGTVARDWPLLAGGMLAPLLSVPRHPLALARFGLKGLRSARGLATARFRDACSRALLAGLAGHSGLALESLGSAAIAVVLGALGHVVGWPFPKGGAQALSNALLAHLESLGGTIETGRRVRSLEELPPHRAALLEVGPGGLIAIAGDRLPGGYRRRLERFRPGVAAFKVDYALAGPVPWKDPACARAATLHLGGTLEEIARSESHASRGLPPDRPLLLAAQPSLFDPTRAPAGRHTLWAYGHVPPGSRFDLTARIEAQIERFAPGFRDLVLGRRVTTPRDLETMNPTLVGGDINGGSLDLWQTIARPVLGPVPYRTPIPGVYLCSASTPPGGGAHGMAGYHAARAALRRELR